jgi:hypothetical protein
MKKVRKPKIGETRRNSDHTIDPSLWTFNYFQSTLAQLSEWKRKWETLCIHILYIHCAQCLPQVRLECVHVQYVGNGHFVGCINSLTVTFVPLSTYGNVCNGNPRRNTIFNFQGGTKKLHLKFRPSHTGIVTYIGISIPGWPDWANFRLVPNGFHWAVF